MAATSFDNVFYTHVLKEIQSLLRAEFPGRKTYIGPAKEDDTSTWSCRIWGLMSELDEQYAGLEGWRRLYTSEILIYFSQDKFNEQAYEQMFRDTERLQQILYNNTVIDGSNNLGWFDGNVVSMDIADQSEDLDYDGLMSIRFEFSCRINRHS